MRQTQENSRLIGYARVSTTDKDLNLQIDDLKREGCVQIFTNKVSGVKVERKGLEECLSSLKENDTLVVWRLDRLGRSLSHLVQIITKLKEQNIKFKSLRDGAIDTTTASGELVFNIFASLAQSERGLIRERTRAGLSSARTIGRLGGRKPIVAQNPKVKMAQAMYQNHSLKIEEICATLKIYRATFYRYLGLK
ncbi:MAG: recombinase family protein [Candidatus Magnetoovum sp. WYHC-5]|nr:recombinase family protein [Candidatus Magnetoovum sp. WYHC-5]